MNFNYLKPGKMYRHNGILKNSQYEVVVVDNEIPNNPDSVLVVVIQKLPNVLRDEFMSYVEHEGNNVSKLAELLSRRKFQSMSTDCYNTLHRQHYITIASKADIIMTPNTATGIPYLEMEKLSAPKVEEPVLTDDEKAVRLVQDAAKKEEEAAQLRETAYALNPSLRPVVHTAPVPRAEVEVEAVAKAPAKAPVKAKAPAKAKVAKDETAAPKRGRKPKTA